MNKPQTKTRKLSLKKETVRVLTDSQLGQVVGGVLTTAINCSVNCQRPSHHCTTAVSCGCNPSQGCTTAINCTR
jgi:hypothetical protein